MRRRRTVAGPVSHSEAAVALLSAEGYTDEEILRILSSVSTVNTVRKLRSLARAKGILVEAFVREAVSAEVQAELEENIQPWALKDALQDRVKSQPAGFPRVRNLWCFLSEGPEADAGDWPARRRLFGRRTARVVDELIGRTGHVAVAWGDHLAAVVAGLKSLPEVREGSRTFYPLRGDPIGGKDPHRTPSALCAELADRYGGKSYSLSGLPGVLPGFLSVTQAESLLAVARKTTDFRRIFPRGKLNPKIGCILTSIGVPGDSTGKEPGFGSVTREHARSWNLPGPLQEWVLGDVAGAFVARDDNPMAATVRKRWERACSRWIGAGLNDLRACAERGEASYRRALADCGGDEKEAARRCLPGTVVIGTGGEARARLLVRLVDLGLVNTIVCDYSLRGALERLLEI